MRKIEQAMVEAVNAGRNWSQDNTQVVFIEKGMHNHTPNRDVPLTGLYRG